ncbi:MAG: rhomboid family intramembrane serine protease [Planctomycetota bacterium]|nr:rhomboid family intramembrane serine protease [Planctomycetota bacterium]
MTTRISPFGTLGRAVCRLPMTCLLILVSCFLYALSVSASYSAGSVSGLVVKPGALNLLLLTDFPDVNGMFKLWEGEWWRLTVSAFHHGNLIHLMMNMLAFWMFADLLEPKLGKLRYFVFCVAAATFSMLPEAALNQSAVGISGMIFAQFGLILVVRRHDEDIAERLHPSLVPICFVSLFVCIPLTIFMDLPIANGAHLFGLLYGAIVGWLCYEFRLRSRLASGAGLMVIHSGLILAILALMRPTWDGRYFAWRAITQTQSLADWQKAVELNPSLETGWRYLAEHYVATGDRHKAWVTVLKGARLNRSTTKLDGLARYVWQQFDSAIDRAVALDEVQQVFGDEHEAWIERFELPLPSQTSSTVLAELAFPDLPATSTVRLDALLDVPAEVSGITRPLPAIFPPGTVNPDHPESARLGVSL